MAEAAAATTVAAAPREDEGEWDGAAEEEVMVLVDLPEFQGVDLFAGARRVEIRNLAAQGAGGRVELVLDGTRRFEGRYEDPLGATLVVDERGRGAGAGIAGDDDEEDDGESDAGEEPAAASGAASASAADGVTAGGGGGGRRGRRGAPVLAVANKVLPMYEIKSGEDAHGDGEGFGGGRGQAARRAQQSRGRGDEEEEEEED